MSDNTFDGFIRFCRNRGLILTETQAAIANALFSLPRASDKTVLLAALSEYNPAVEPTTDSSPEVVAPPPANFREWEASQPVIPPGQCTAVTPAPA